MLAALSGGADSVCLVHFLANNQKRLGIKVCAAHFMHGIRLSEAQKELELVKRLCESLDIELETGEGDVPSYARENGMGLEELKKSGWGYQKDAVFQYITQQEEAFTQKLEEKDALLERTDRQAQDRIQELEQENRALKRELEGLRKQQDQISRAILDARASAEELKAESRAQGEAAREEVRRALEGDLAELARYREEVADLRRAIQTAVKGLERQTEELEQRAEELYEAAPAGNLTLFQ